jgi:small subunit ribosomal protein S16
MVTIRLSRGGAKARPFYHVVVTDSRSKRDGRFIERIGFFNPIAVKQDVPFQIARDRYDYWVSTGAQPSDRVARLVKQFSATAA